MAKITVSKKAKKLLDKLVKLESIYPEEREINANKVLERVLKEEIKEIETEIEVEANPPEWKEL